MQFHWIFLLIAGALIIGFFVSFASRQAKTGEERISIRLGGIFDTILVNALQSPGTSQSMLPPSKGMAFACSEQCDCSFDPGNVPFMTLDKLIFAPGKLVQQPIALWTLEWDIPFRAANFVFLTNQLIRYYIVYAPSDQQSLRFALDINKTIPQRDAQGRRLVSVELLDSNDLGSLEGQKLQEVRLIFAGIEPPGSLDASFGRSKLTAVKLDGDLGGGTADFYEADEDANLVAIDSQPFLGKAGAYAAIFSATPTMYKCGMAKALLRLGYVAKVLSGRIASLQGSREGRCLYFATTALDEMANLGFDGHKSSDLSKLQGIPALRSQLEQENHDKLAGSCPSIY